MAEGFDDFGMDDFDPDKISDYSDTQLGEIFDKFSTEKDRLYEKYGDGDNVTGKGEVRYEEYSDNLKQIRKEIRRREKSKKESDKGSDKENVYEFFKRAQEEKESEKENEGSSNITLLEKQFDETSWIDDNYDYRSYHLGVVRKIGTKENFLKFINGLVNRKGEINVNANEDEKIKYTNFLRSYLALSDGGGNRPLLDNHNGFELMKDTTFGKGGSIKTGGLTTILTYKREGVRVINVTNGTIKKMNEGSEKEKEFTGLIKAIFAGTNKTVKRISEETKIDPIVVQETIDVDYEELYPKNKFVQHTDKMIGEMVKERHKYHKKLPVSERIKTLMEDIRNIPDSISNGESSNTTDIDLPQMPEVVTDEIIDSSVTEIHNSLHEHAEQIEELVLTDQELREFSGILNPVGDQETKIESLNQVADEYRLKALNEHEPRKSQLYQNISETAELKIDLITIVGLGDQPRFNEAISILNEEIESNESVNDLRRLEKLKKWIKENWLGASALIITVASLLTTVVIAARHSIKAGAKAVGSFSKSVYKIFKDLAKRLGPILGPVISAVGSLLTTLLKYGALGIAFLAQNLWILVVAFVYFIYNRNSNRKRK